MRTYFRRVVDDLLSRGILRRQRGQSLDDIMAAEAKTVLQEVSGDVAEIARELGVSLGSALVSTGVRALENAGARLIADLLWKRS